MPRLKLSTQLCVLKWRTIELKEGMRMIEISIFDYSKNIKQGQILLNNCFSQV